MGKMPEKSLSKKSVIGIIQTIVKLNYLSQKMVEGRQISAAFNSSHRTNKSIS